MRKMNKMNKMILVGIGLLAAGTANAQSFYQCVPTIPNCTTGQYLTRNESGVFSCGTPQQQKLCAAGQKLNTSSNECEACESGTYQDEFIHSKTTCKTDCTTLASMGSRVKIYCPWAATVNYDDAKKPEHWSCQSSGATTSSQAVSTRFEADGSGEHCHCRYKDQNGVFSSWVFIDYNFTHYSGCKNGCIDVCKSTVYGSVKSALW